MFNLSEYYEYWTDSLPKISKIFISEQFVRFSTSPVSPKHLLDKYKKFNINISYRKLYLISNENWTNLSKINIKQVAIIDILVQIFQSQFSRNSSHRCARKKIIYNWNGISPLGALDHRSKNDSKRLGIYARNPQK